MTILTGTAVGQGLVIAVSPLLTRAYAPSDFGALAIVTALASIVGAWATLGTDRAVAVAPDRAATASLVVFGAATTTGVASVTSFVAWWFRADVSERFRAPALSDFWWIVPVTVFAVGLHRIGSAVLARRRQHGSIAVRNAAQGIAQTLWNLSMAFAGPIGLVGGLAVGRFAAIVGMLRVRPSVAALPSPAATWRTLRAHRHFVLVTPWSAALNVIGQQAPALLIAAMHGSAAAGFVALTMRVLGAPVGMVADAVAQYAAGAFGLRVRAGDPVRGLLARFTSRLFLGGSVAAVLVLLLGPSVFGAVFGADWQLSGTYAQILAPAFAVQVVVSPMTQVLSMLGRQTAQLSWDAGRLALTSAAVLVPSALGAPMPVVLAALSAAMVVSYLVMLVLVVLAARSPMPSHHHVEEPAPA
ncbi:lipopolysaccharide biosynthesis protein [Curtobacterium pusillum]|uniref:lipopolysaccharide biosynthesis protein n=1 Tax=Curtobacterium pusillum TaxID=69373 RepID=UPI001643D91C|nr:oligosaccharide flippase family protein [Curtobacterium pusillum]